MVKLLNRLAWLIDVIFPWWMVACLALVVAMTIQRECRLARGYAELARGYAELAEKHAELAHLQGRE